MFRCFLSNDEGNCDLNNEVCIVNTDKYDFKESVFKQCQTLINELKSDSPEVSKAIDKNIIR